MSENVEKEREKTRTQTTNKQSSKVKRQRLTNASRLVVKTYYFSISIVLVDLSESETAHFLFFSLFLSGWYLHGKSDTDGHGDSTATAREILK